MSPRRLHLRPPRPRTHLRPRRAQDPGQLRQRRAPDGRGGRPGRHPRPHLPELPRRRFLPAPPSLSRCRLDSGRHRHLHAARIQDGPAPFVSSLRPVRAAVRPHPIPPGHPRPYLSQHRGRMRGGHRLPHRSGAPFRPADQGRVRRGGVRGALRLCLSQVHLGKRPRLQPRPQRRWCRRRRGRRHPHRAGCLPRSGAAVHVRDGRPVHPPEAAELHEALHKHRRGQVGGLQRRQGGGLCPPDAHVQAQDETDAVQRHRRWR
mmetsp:Transcript_1481/g.4278  ORF Transcript_1481/g.4278 Transcript_1481/m.4278 type:complete len:261 (-) Transcript_1481:378-1160(-)